jgi:hypothetical protein
MRDTMRFSGALATVTLLFAGVMTVILAACGGGYGGGGGGGGGGMTCGSGYVMCPLPTITLTAPAGGAVTGTIALSATASASSTYNLTVTSVEFLVDGKMVGAGTLSGSVYTYMWNSASVMAGSHTVTATVTDSAGGKMTTNPGVMITTNGMAAVVSMTPGQIFPTPMSQGMGMGNMTIKSETGAVRGTVKLEGVNATAVSINEGFAGATGPALIRLARSGGSANEWQVPSGALLTERQLTELSHGGFYVVAASAAHPRGEIRGQIVPEGISVTFSAMTPVREAQSVSARAGGVVAATVDRNALTLSVHVNSTGVDDADAARVASAATGRTLAVLSKDPVDMGHWSAELAPIGAAELSHFEAGDWNVRIATPVETNGALHGQISAPAR